MTGLVTRVYQVEGSGRTRTAVLSCSGEIDIATIETLERALKAAIETGTPVVEVDLRKVSYVDSCTIETLLRAYSNLAGEGRELRLNAGSRILRLLRLLRLDSVLPVCASGDPDLAIDGPFGWTSDDRMPMSSEGYEG
jgi:anti-anti-sigma factor